MVLRSPVKLGHTEKLEQQTIELTAHEAKQYGVGRTLKRAVTAYGTVEVLKRGYTTLHGKQPDPTYETVRYGLIAFKGQQAIVVEAGRDRWSFYEMKK